MLDVSGRGGDLFRGGHACMNKAFLRESDSTEEYCPRCGSLGQPVSRDTVMAQVQPDADVSLAVTANFCPHPQCEVAYFDMFERMVQVAALRRPVFPKDPDAPICACFGFTRADIDRDLAEGVVTRTRGLLDRARSQPTQCETLAANGRSCVPDVQRYYMQRRNA
jgi:hypothetical protein